MKNSNNEKSKVSFFRSKNEYGGPGTFLRKLSRWMDINNFTYDIYPKQESKNILIISSSKKIFFLIFKKLCGHRIIQRLDGYLWDHKYQNNKKVIYKYILINFLMNFLRKYVANIVIYQSHYLKDEWEKKYSKVKNYKVILNATDNFFFLKKNKKKSKKFKLVCVEGTIQENFYTFNLIKSLALITQKNKNIENFEIYGKYPKKYKKKLSQYTKTVFKGIVKKEKISEIYNKEKIIFFVLEQYPACPNSVIEALASDTIVLGFNNGSLLEMLEYKSFLINFYNLEKMNNFFYVLNKVQKKIEFTMQNFNILKMRLKIISKKFRIDRMGKKYLKVFNS